MCLRRAVLLCLGAAGWSACYGPLGQDKRQVGEPKGFPLSQSVKVGWRLATPRDPIQNAFKIAVQTSTDLLPNPMYVCRDVARSKIETMYSMSVVLVFNKRLQFYKAETRPNNLVQFSFDQREPRFLEMLGPLICLYICIEERAEAISALKSSTTSCKQYLC